MIRYKVQLQMPSGAFEEEWKTWMKDVHIRDVLDTGCFFDFKFYKIISNGVPTPPGRAHYEIDYFARTKEDFDRYISNFADKLRQEHIDKFGTENITIKRESYEVEDILKEMLLMPSFQF